MRLRLCRQGCSLWRGTLIALSVIQLLFTTTVTNAEQAESDNIHQDNWQTSFTCPATTVCPLLCVPPNTACPTTYNNNNDNDNDIARYYEQLPTPPSCPCATWVPCPAVLATLPTCQTVYQAYYQNQAVRSEETSQIINASTTITRWRPSGRAILVNWLLWVTFLSAGVQYWHRWRHQQSLTIIPLEASSTIPPQYGWRPHTHGTWLGRAVYTTRVGWLLLLIVLAYHYYAVEDPTARPLPFFAYTSQEETLRHFIVVWTFGLIWNLVVPSGTALVLWSCTPCPLGEATLVTFGDEEQDDNDKEAEVPSPKPRRLVSFMHRVLEWLRREPPVVCPVTRLGEHTRCVTHHLERFVWDPTAARFAPARWYHHQDDAGHNNNIKLRDVGQVASTGLSRAQVYERWQAVGSNTLDVPVPHFAQALSQELAQPFYTYQWFMIASWCPLDYYYMAFVWFLVISTSALAVAWFHYRNQRNLYRLAHVHGTVDVLRNGLWTTVSPTALVPGDLIRLSPDMVVPCDLILVQGGTCLVDESALTGESYPQAKIAVDPTDTNGDVRLSDDALSHGNNARHVLCAGTSLLQHEEDNLAVVWRTGSSTSKGELLRNVVSYKRDSFQFDTEVGLVLIALFCYAVICFIIVVNLIQDKAVYGWFYAVYCVATILPPLLPTVFTVSVGVSDDRLARKRIATAQSESILIAGKVTHAFFDKTGTLTKQGLDFLKVHTFGVEDSHKLDLLRKAQAVCHALTPSTDGQLIGNPVDNAMFQASGAHLVTSNSEAGTVVRLQSGEELSIVRRFEFDHHRMVQSVIVQTADPSRFVVMAKGSGESIQRLSLPESIPASFESEVAQSARDGIYQISVAFKELSPDFSLRQVFDLPRDEVESGLTYLGAFDFRNVMRQETPDVIQQLKYGGVTSAMVTGDSVNTGIRIAFESGILQYDKDVLVGDLDANGDGVIWTFESGANTMTLPDIQKLVNGTLQLAMTGKAWAYLVHYDPDTARMLVPYVKVFGRCTPHDKVTVIRMMVSLGHVTLMCGDGGNDTGALKAAHTGIALSDAEASMVAPFASLDKEITSVLDVLKEGRCALASALATYKYMIMYGQIETINQIFNAYFQITFSEWCWVFMDGIWTVTMAFTLPLAKPAEYLSATLPTSSILGWQTLSSTIGVLFINFAFTVMAILALMGQDWYACRNWTGTDVSNANIIGDNYEAEVLFLVTGYQYISSAMCYNFGFEFRKGWWSNVPFVAAAAVFSFFHFFSVLFPSHISCVWRVNCDNEHAVMGITSFDPLPINNPFHTTVMPVDFRWALVAFMIVNTVAVMGYEYALNKLRQRYFEPALRAAKPPKDAFLPLPTTESLTVT